MAKASEKQTDPISNALHAVTAGSPAENAPQHNHQAQAQAETQKKADANTEVSAKPVVAAVLAPRPKRKLMERRLTPQGNLHNKWDVTAARGDIVADILEPDYWALVAPRLRPFDEINVLCEDGSWRADVQVISADRQWAKVFLLQSWDLMASYANMPKTQEEEYEVTWTVIGKYAVVKKNLHGQPPLKDGFQTKLEAYQWLDGHLKTLNA